MQDVTTTESMKKTHSRQYRLWDVALNAPGVHTSHSGDRYRDELDVRRREPGSVINASTLPDVNAALNAADACFLTAGYFFIRRKNVRAHQMSMVAAFLTSSLFLASYLYYHYQVGHSAAGDRPRRSAGEGLCRRPFRRGHPDCGLQGRAR